MNNLIIGIVGSVFAALLAAVAYFTKRIMDDTKAMRSEMRPITPAIIEIQGKFTQAGHTLLFPLTVAPGSPLKLTEYGRKLIDESGFEKILEECRDELVQQVIDTNPTTNYDIQVNAKVIIEKLLEGDDHRLKPLKDYAFNNGLPVDIFVPPAGIVLRDEVMKDLKFSDD